ncbi:MAG: hypothetical protein ABR613_02945 [Actinomycetota bacterium]
MSQDPQKQGETTESTERIPPGSTPPGDANADEGRGDDPSRKGKALTDDEKADEESKDSFPASDPPAW